MEGHMENNRGWQIPVGLVEPIDKARDELVKELTAKAAEVSKTMTEFKTFAMGEVRAFVDLSHREFGVVWGGKKGNITLVSYNGAFKVEIAVADRLAFDERLQAAKTLIDECMAEWSEGANPKLVVIIAGAFRTDRQGKINVGKVLELRRHKFPDEKWNQAMDAISKSILVLESKEYVRFYIRNDSGKYDQIPLDFAAA